MFNFYHSDEQKLLATLKELTANPSGWFAAYYRFSKLHQSFKNDLQMRLVVNIIKDHGRNYDGKIFLMQDYDIIFLYEGKDKHLLEKTTAELREVFNEDPLAFLGDGLENKLFCKQYALVDDIKEFEQICKIKVAEANATKGIELENKAVDNNNKTLKPLHLMHIESNIHKIDLSQAIRKQPICAIIKGKEGTTKVFEELYVNIKHLSDLLKHEVNFTSNRFLFRYLTGILDKAVLTYLKGNANNYLNNVISLNINVDSIFSSEFQEFDQLLSPDAKKKIIIEVHVADIFSDISLFIKAREKLHKLGYKICLDGLDNLSFLQVDRESLGFDLAKLQWNADIKSSLLDEENKKFVEAVKNCGSSRIILCRCDNQYAIDYGHALGISIFQGWHVDKLINPTSKVVN
jgi:hypothetical protein